MSNQKVALTRKAAVTLGALTVYLRPKLAADAQLNLEPILADVTEKNFAAKKPHIISAIQKQVNGHLAKDANIGTLAQLLDALELESAPVEAGPGVHEANPMSGKPEMSHAAHGAAGMPNLIAGQGAPEHTGVTKDDPPMMGGGMGGGTGGGPIGMEQLKAFLASKGMHPADIEQACQMACGPSGPGAGSKAPPPAGGPSAAPAPAPKPSPNESGASSGGGGGGESEESSSDKAKDANGAFASGKGVGFAETSHHAPSGGANAGAKTQNPVPGPATPEMLDQEHNHKFEEHTPGRGANFTTNDSPPDFSGMPKPGGAMDSNSGDLNMADKRQIEEAVALAAKNAIKQAQDQMGAAVKAAVEKERETQRAIREAENDVRPYIGHVAQAFDSAEEIYRTALNTLGVKLEGVHPSAYKVILGLQPLPNAQRRVSPASIVASDSKGVSDFAARNPQAAKIEIL